MEASAMAARLSKSKIGDLAIRSALDIERSPPGTAVDTSALRDLSLALRYSKGTGGEPSRTAYMRPGYFEPFERLYRSREETEVESPDQIGQFVDKAIRMLDEAVSAPLSESDAKVLVDICLGLHKEFIQRRPSETTFGRSKQSEPLEAFVG